MNAYTVTVTIQADSREAAGRMVTDKGFAVEKVTAKRAPRVTAPVSESVARIGRASALTDMPQGLDRDAAKAYVRGYAKGCMTYTRKHGAPSITGTGTVDRVELRRITRAHEWDRHPSAHKAALRELGKWGERHTVVTLAA